MTRAKPKSKPEQKPVREELPKAHSIGTVGHVWINGKCECGAKA